MATLLKPAAAVIDPFDVSRAELYAEHRWHEPFRHLRAQAPVYYCANSEFGPYWTCNGLVPVTCLSLCHLSFESQRANATQI
jgi:hypothetical protein